MGKKISKISLGLAIFFLCLPSFTFASSFSSDLFINNGDIDFSDNDPVLGQTIRIYATVRNNSNMDLKGAVSFFNTTTNKTIGENQAVSVFAKSSDGVFVDFSENKYGRYNIRVSLIPSISEGDNPENNTASKTIFFDIDSDRDSVPNHLDIDDDNDGVFDRDDAFPLDPKEQKDTDGDGIGNNADTDDDNDGVDDSTDLFPLDPSESIDSDGDGIGDNSDPDDDNDSILDFEEIILGTDPTLFDTDADSFNDKDDPSPLNPNVPARNKGTQQAPYYATGGGGRAIKNSEKKKKEKKIKKIRPDEPVYFDSRDFINDTKNIVYFEWDFGDGTKSKGLFVKHTYKEKGRKKVTLTTIDKNNESKKISFPVKIADKTPVILYAVYGLPIIILIVIFILIAPKKKKRKRKN